MTLLPDDENIPQVVKTEQAFQALKAQTDGGVDNHKLNFITSWNLFWHNPLATASMLCERAGVNAYKLFYGASAAQDYILTYDPTWVKLIPLMKPVFGQDGSVALVPWQDSELLAMNLSDKQLKQIGREDLIPTPEPVVEPEQPVVETPESENGNG